MDWWWGSGGGAWGGGGGKVVQSSIAVLVYLITSMSNHLQVREADVHILKEMFPDIQECTIRQLRLEQNMSTNDVIDVLVSQQEKSKSLPLQALLLRHSRVNIEDNNEYLLKTNRHCIWNKARVFYKRAVLSPSLLKQGLMIEFSGEEGADAGALRLEFFEKVLQEVNENWFEGSEERRIPRCHWGSEVELEMAGTMVAHSLLLGGPGLPCVHPGVYHMMVFGDSCISDLHADNLPNSEDIPRDASTIDLLEMISNVCKVVMLAETILSVWVQRLLMLISCHPHTHR